MINEHSSTGCMLHTIIDRIEIESEQENTLTKSMSKCSDIEIEISTKGSIVTVASEISEETEEICCRICYDTNHPFPIIYPCECKVSYKVDPCYIKLNNLYII